MTEPLSKAQLRAEAAARRAEAQAADPHAGERLVEAFPDALTPARGAVVAGYWPFRSEIDPRPLMRRLAESGARLALPVTPAKGANLPLSFRLWDETHTLTPGHFAVQEPPAHAETVEPDLVLVPLLAYDAAGHRLGYGAGHYDRTLARLRTVKPVTALGLAYAVQAVSRLVTGPHDQKLDGIITERGYSPVS